MGSAAREALTDLIDLVVDEEDDRVALAERVEDALREELDKGEAMGRALALEAAAEMAFARMREATAKASQPVPDGMPAAAWRQRVAMWKDTRGEMHALAMELRAMAAAARGTPP